MMAATLKPVLGFGQPFHVRVAVIHCFNFHGGSSITRDWLTNYGDSRTGYNFCTSFWFKICGSMIHMIYVTKGDSA